MNQTDRHTPEITFIEQDRGIEASIEGESLFFVSGYPSSLHRQYGLEVIRRYNTHADLVAALEARRKWKAAKKEWEEHGDEMDRWDQNLWVRENSRLHIQVQLLEEEADLAEVSALSRARGEGGEDV